MFDFYYQCWKQLLKGVVHFEINFLYVLAYLKGIQDVTLDVFVSTAFSILTFLVKLLLSL